MHRKCSCWKWHEIKIFFPSETSHNIKWNCKKGNRTHTSNETVRLVLNEFEPLKPEASTADADATVPTSSTVEILSSANKSVITWNNFEYQTYIFKAAKDEKIQNIFHKMVKWICESDEQVLGIQNRILLSYIWRSPRFNWIWWQYSFQNQLLINHWQ